MNVFSYKHFKEVGWCERTPPLENDMTTETPKPVPTVTPTAKVAPKVTSTHPTTHADTSAHVESNVPKAKVSPNVIQPSPTPATLVSEPAPGNAPRQAGTQGEINRKDARARGYSIGPNEPPATIKVKNVHTIALNLEAGIIQPGNTGLATDAEVSNLLGLYLERV